MTAQTIHVQTELPTGPERVWEAMQHPASFLYVTRGAFAFPALAGRTDPIRAGEIGTGWVFAFHLVPLHRHTIEVVEVNEATRTILTHEHGGVLRRWDHTLHVEELEPNRCRYSDTVVIDAGVLSGVVCAGARALYRYRQRRWARLVRKHLLPGGPAHMSRSDGPAGGSA